MPKQTGTPGAFSCRMARPPRAPARPTTSDPAPVTGPLVRMLEAEALHGPIAVGNGTMRDLLGGKGAGLAEMTNAGVPVPAGFTITTAVCTEYYANKGKLSKEVAKEVETELRRRGIELFVAPTAEAVREYNRRAGETGVVAALHLTC